jgi:hypothetical protein
MLDAIELRRDVSETIRLGEEPLFGADQASVEDGRGREHPEHDAPILR